MLVGKTYQAIRPRQKDDGNMSSSRVPLPSKNMSPIDSSTISLNIYNNERPLKTNSKNLSFKGLSFMDDILYKPFNKGMTYSVEEALEFSNKYIGPMAEDLYHSVKSSKLVSSNLFNEKKGVVTFGKKSIPHLIWDGLIYPFKILGPDLLNSVVGFFTEHGPFKKSATELYNQPMFKNIRQRSKIDAKVNTLRSIFDFKNAREIEALEARALKDKVKVSELSEKVKEEVKQSVATNMQSFVNAYKAKQFDPKTGNYDTKLERGLARVVSGLPVAFFLANDAYNLSRMMDDDPKNATKEKKARFRQEVSRIGMNSYLTLVTLGSLQKYINNSAVGIMLTTALTALTTESYSRLRNGKHITRLTPEQAQAINLKENNKENIATGAQMKPLTFTQQPQTNAKDKEKQQKPLLSVDMLLKASAWVIAGGFALKGIRKFPAIDNIFKESFKPLNKFYNNLTKIKNETITTTKLNEIAKVLSENGFDKFAKDYIKIAERSRIATKDALIASLNKSKEIKTLNGFITKISDASSTPEKITNKEFKDVIDLLKTHGFDEVANKYNFSIAKQQRGNNETITALKNVVEELKTRAGKNQSLIDQINANGLDKQIDEGIFETIKTLVSKTHDEQLAQNYKSVLEGNINLGSRDKKVKPMVDFVIAPFKFAWSTVTLPYAKVANKLIHAFDPKKPPKALSELEVFANSVENMGRQALRKDFDPQKFKTFVNDNTLKGFNTDTMSNISNSDLSNLAKTAAAAATIWFLMTDNYNMVMLKSNGRDVDGAKTKFKERFVQEGSRLFYQTLLIDLFNSTFRKQYNASLLGMSWITLTDTTIGEWLTRKSVGIPIKTHSRDELAAIEKKQDETTGVLKGYYNFMRRLTGKRPMNSYNVKKNVTDKTSEASIAVNNQPKQENISFANSSSNMLKQMIKG